MKNIFVTGISKGLGLRLTRALVEDADNRVIGCSRTMTPELDELMSAYPGRLEWHPVDLRHVADLEPRLAGIIGGRSVDAVVNNAAILYKSLLVKADLKAFQDMLDVNLTAPVIVSKVMISNFLRNQKKGVMLFYSSICAHEGFSGLSLMGASKGAVESLSKSISFEYGRKGIRSNVVCIGILDAGMSDTVTQAQYSDLIARSHLKQSTDIGSVVELSKYLMSDNALSVTGQVFHVNCGIL